MTEPTNLSDCPDSRKAEPASIQALDFVKQGGLVPVIAQDVESNAVLMLAYANEAALRKTQETEFASYPQRRPKGTGGCKSRAYRLTSPRIVGTLYKAGAAQSTISNRVRS